ncbi:hypothetical protein FXO37_17843 [Capsicum annuum]|nr:hypothetical protein FXO37_17843 [Capsicum annuum]
MPNLTKTFPNQSSSNFNPVLLFETSEEASSHSIQLAVSKKLTNSSLLSPSIKIRSFPSEDMHKFWTLTHNEKFLTFKNLYVVPGQVINLSLLKESHCNISHLFKAQELSMMFCLFGLDILKDPICMTSPIFIFPLTTEN